MRIFLSYPSEERDTAERISLRLGGQGHEVFFDREDLEPGREYDESIASEIARCDLLVFLITPASVAPGRYTRTELALAERRWPHPSGHVLPVLLRPTDREEIPEYLLAVSYLKPTGDAAAEVATAVRVLARPRRRRAWVLGGVGAALVAGLASVWALRGDGNAPPAPPAGPPAFEPVPGMAALRPRWVLPTPEGFAAVTANPSALVRFDERGERIRDVPLPSEATAVAASPSGKQLLIALRDSGVVVMDAERWTVIDRIPFSPAAVEHASGGRVSARIREIAFAEGTVWAAVEGPDGDAALLRLRRPEKQWVEASWGYMPDGYRFDARGVRLRAVNDELWAVSAAGDPPSLHRVVGVTRVDAFPGDSIDAVRCAHDVAQGAAGGLLLLSCDGTLQEMRLDGRKLVSGGPAKEASLPSAGVSGVRLDELVARAGGDVFVATSVYDDPPGDAPNAALLYHVADSGGRKVAQLAEAVITSLAVAPRSVVAVIRRLDGSVDVVSIPR